MIEHHIETNGIKLRAYEYSHTGEPIVFLHYLGGASRIWNAVIPQFVKNYRVFAIDLRGHGKTEQPESGYGMESMAEDVKGVLDVLQLDRVHFVGSSLGCYVGTRFASLYPEKVISLVNSEGALQNDRGPNGKLGDSETREELVQKYFGGTGLVQKYFGGPEPEFNSRETFMEYMMENWKPWNEVRKRALEDYDLRKLDNGKFTFPLTMNTRLQIAEALSDLKLEEWYQNVTCPVLYLPAEKEGDLDKKLASIEQFKLLLKESKTVVIPETTHAMMFEHYDELSREIHSFYNEI